MSGLTGKVALITGGGSGIGEAVARRFVAQGAKVGIIGRRAAPLQALAKEIGALALPGDVSDQASVDDAVAKLVKEYGGLDIVVNNAGISVVASFEDLDDAGWNSVMETNLNGTRRAARAAVPHMRKRGGGAIVNISSIGSLFASRNNAAYTTAKAGLNGLTMALARDFGPENIRVNAICPGWVDTPMLAGLLDFMSAQRKITKDEVRALLVQFNPLNRLGKPDEIAKCVEFLATDASSFVTGTTLLVDGGQAIVDVGTVAFSPR
jgi:NAD(P)-dependent dehydrogenase (short-subunit alcohol dehydrogenase family)